MFMLLFWYVCCVFSKSWQVFRRRAVELSDALRSLWPNIEITLNSKVPRKGAFEFVLIKSDGSGMGTETNLKHFTAIL